MATRVDTAPAFELDAFEVGDGHIVVRGHWLGTRGLRFVRPTLTVAGRRLLATLEHKPWAPEGNWVSSFPWDGEDDVDPAQAYLAVASGVEVRLAPGDERAEAHERAREDEIEVERSRFERRASEVDFLRDELRRAHAERDRLRAQLDEAVRDREAAVRTRDRSARLEAEATASAKHAVGEARAETAEARRDRDAVISERDTARRQRDELLVAYRALEKRVHRTPEPVPRAPEPAPAVTAADDVEKPLGMKAIPATTAELSDLIHDRPHHELSKYDLMAFRVIGAVAAVAFCLLLLSLLKLFV